MPVDEQEQGLSEEQVERMLKDCSDETEQVRAEAHEAIRAGLARTRSAARGTLSSKRGVGPESQAEPSGGRVRKEGKAGSKPQSKPREH